MRIIPLSEGSFTIGKDKIFHPFNAQHHELQQRPTGSLLVEVQPFCIVTNRDVLLIDTGLGFKANGMLQIHSNLIANGIAPEQVTKVLLSHLHKDHAGGISYNNRLGNAMLAFPQATHFVQRREYEYAENTGLPSYMPDEFEILDSHPQVFWLHDDEGTIDNYIHYMVTAAHSPYHQVFLIESEAGLLFFGGDDAPQHKQMINRFVAKYDFDGKKCMQLRQQWWQQGSTEGWTFMFYHDINHPVVKG